MVEARVNEYAVPVIALTAPPEISTKSEGPRKI
jgi:hypothetical protein